MHSSSSPHYCCLLILAPQPLAPRRLHARAPRKRRSILTATVCRTTSLNRPGIAPNHITCAIAVVVFRYYDNRRLRLLWWIARIGGLLWIARIGGLLWIRGSTTTDSVDKEELAWSSDALLLSNNALRIDGRRREQCREQQGKQGGREEVRHRDST